MMRKKKLGRLAIEFSDNSENPTIADSVARPIPTIKPKYALLKSIICIFCRPTKLSRISPTNLSAKNKYIRKIIQERKEDDEEIVKLIKPPERMIIIKVGLSILKIGRLSFSI